MLYQKIQPLAREQDIADIGVSLATTYKKAKVMIDQDAAGRAGIPVNQIANTLAILISGDKISLQRNNFVESIKNISLTNMAGEKIPLSSMTKIEYGFVSPSINTDEKEESYYIYGEMGNNSVVYPTVKLYSYLSSKDFL